MAAFFASQSLYFKYFLENTRRYKNKLLLLESVELIKSDLDNTLKELIFLIPVFTEDDKKSRMCFKDIVTNEAAYCLK